MKRLISLLAAVLITAAALVFALWDADFAVLWQTLLSGRHWVLLPFLAVLGIFFLSNAIRWTLLLDPFGCFSARQVLPSMMIGFAANNLLPLRVGELIRAYLFAREFRIARSGVLMTLVLERVLDLVAILAIYALGLLLLPDAPAAMRAGLWLATLGIGAIAAAVLAFAVMPQRIDRLWLSVSASMSQAVQARGSTYLEQFAKALANSNWISEQQDRRYTDTYEDWESAERLWSAVRQLPGKWALVIRLFYQNDKTINEISELTSINENTVKTYLCRAREKLRSLLRNEY